MLFQPLESRRHYSVSHYLDLGGTLTVQGDSANDVITVEEIGGSVMVNPPRRFYFWPPAGGYPVAAVRNIVVRGGAGNDQITVNSSLPADIAGEDGNDVVFGGFGDDRIDGGAGDDTLGGRSGNDTVGGGAGFGFDVINGDDGDDVLLADGGADRYAGGAGRDHLTYAGRTAGVIVMPGTPGHSGDYTYGSEGDSVGIDIEVFTLGSGDDYFLGGSAADVTVFGGPGNDGLEGWDGNDALYGEDGNDWLVGEGGNDLLVGGAGDDALYGYAGDDTLVGNGGLDYFSGGDGNDTIDARDGVLETVDGGAGTDVAYIDRLWDFWSGFRQDSTVGVELAL
jgi:Ca2+-binding RTX toxin-like protein